MLSAAQDDEIGGMHLPYVVEAAANGYFGKASVNIGAGMLTIGNAGLLAVLRCFHRYELPKIGAWLTVVAAREPVCREMLNQETPR